MGDIEAQVQKVLQAMEAIAREHPHLTLAELEAMHEDPERREEATRVLLPLAEAVAPAVVGIHEFIVNAADVVVRLQAEIQRAADSITAAVDFLKRPGQPIERISEVVGVAFEPYREQIARGSDGAIPPVPLADQIAMLAIAGMASWPHERERGVLPPLEQVAFFTRRYDIVAAAIRHRHPGLAKRLRALKWEPGMGPGEAERRAIADLYLVLGDQFLKRVRRAVRKMPVALVRVALEELLSERYIFAALRNAHLEDVRRESWLSAQRKGGCDVSAVPARGDEEQRSIARADVRAEALRYLRESSDPELDLAIMQAMANGISMETLAAQVGRPASTLRDRRARLKRHLAPRLKEDPMP
jgi:hypothetical protein